MTDWYRSQTGPRRGLFSLLLRGVLLLLIAAALFVGYRMLRAPSPEIALAAPFDVVGRNAPLVIEVKDALGLRSVRATIAQGDAEQQILEEHYDPPRKEALLRWSAAKDQNLKLREGPGKLTVTARNASWANFFEGRSASLVKEFTARLAPPRVEVLTRQHYVNQGGCDMVVYKTSPAAESGVVVGETFFRGYALPGAGDASLHFAIFAVPYNADPAAPIRLRARDEARNETLVGLWAKVFPKKFRTREIALDDAFLEKVVTEIRAQTPSLPDKGGLLENYLVINRDLRKANNDAIVALRTKSRPQFLWKEPFRQLSNSQVEASFADHRIYKHAGQEVDRQDHLGYDLATVARAPVSASNDGVVLLAEYLGIYGNTVVIDHGYGLLSLYGHLSSFGVSAGDAVTRGQTIGQSGETGLAGGDHLHFSMVLQGTQVDAREWWDAHWIHDRIQAKLKEFAAPEPAASEG
jgi:murein DD-endopeptidase MepM/ murein hydrolase activator NlpD